MQKQQTMEILVMRQIQGILDAGHYQALYDLV